eukprot:TRINITY_DN6306_c0_g1_i4.p2 TRINITY_DN6306_c0_g1~~TRINITY_DN6306_c0_g1_i4.p2  ORF type:complete len:131 (-),score=35.76 TRINITY_DN6306_c0_g1_i4:562-954(-)
MVRKDAKLREVMNKLAEHVNDHSQNAYAFRPYENLPSRTQSALEPKLNTDSRETPGSRAVLDMSMEVRGLVTNELELVVSAGRVECEDGAERHKSLEIPLSCVETKGDTDAEEAKKSYGESDYGYKVGKQ